MVQEHPILFSGDMVKAILEGRKTQTRRIVKGAALEWLQPGMFTPEFVASDENMLCPYGTVGDRLWVRETWRETGSAQMADGKIPDLLHPSQCKYKADADYEGPWRPSIFMPRSASRITLGIVDIKIQRAHDITNEDAVAEGITMPEVMNTEPAYIFANLWDMINGKKAPWRSNPWVWVIQFRVTRIIE